MYCCWYTNNINPSVSEWNKFLVIWICFWGERLRFFLFNESCRMWRAQSFIESLRSECNRRICGDCPKQASDWNNYDRVSFQSPASTLLSSAASISITEPCRPSCLRKFITLEMKSPRKDVMNDVNDLMLADSAMLDECTTFFSATASTHLTAMEKVLIGFAMSQWVGCVYNRLDAWWLGLIIPCAKKRERKRESAKRSMHKKINRWINHF